MVATPIGNLADLSLRAIHVLSLVDAVACEDTRHSAALLQHLGLSKPLIAAHAHNEREAAAALIERLARGQRVAFVSDAGTPAISDPGALLVQAVRAAGYVCVPIPGANSAVTAMSVAGDAAGTAWRFVGFLPTKSAERTAHLRSMAQDSASQLLFEAPHRIEALATSLATVMPDRSITLCRELTKQFETIVTLRAAELPAWLAFDANRTRGEFVVVVHAPTTDTSDDDAATHDRILRILLAQLPLKQAVAIAAELSGAPRNGLYSRALALKDTPS